MSKAKRKTSSFFGGDYTLRFLGFVADMIAIVGLIFAFKTETVVTILPYVLSPWILFPMWVVSVYTYICWLHHYWANTSEENKWSATFGSFVIGELIFRMRKPNALFPGVLLLIALVWIINITEMWRVFAVIVGIPCFFLLVSSPFWGHWLKRKFVIPSSLAEKETVEEKWAEFMAFVDKKLDRQMWIKTSEFKDIKEVWGFDDATLRYAIAKYSVEFPDRAHLGDVVRLNGRVEIASGVLINVETLDRKKYYFK